MESTKKNRSWKTLKGDQLLTAIAEPARGAARRKDGYLRAMYLGIAAHGEKRAVIAVAWAILRATWHVLSEAVEYEEPGGDYFDRVKKRADKDQTD